MNCVDSIGLPKFGERQSKAMIQMIQRTGKLLSEPPDCEGKGIIIAGGGKYLSHAWVVCRILRQVGCKLPIQVWHMGEREMPKWARPMFGKLDAEPVDAYLVMKVHPVRQMSGWILKNYAIAHCPWRQVLFLDADCLPSRSPEELMSEVEHTGGLFFSDVANHAPAPWGYIYCGLSLPEKEWEAGQYIVDKVAGWMGLRWAMWLNEHTDVFFNLVHGDKGTTELGFRMSGVPHIVSVEPHWAGWGISQRWNGVEWFRHCMAAKRGETPWPQDAARLFEEWRANTL